MAADPPFPKIKILLFVFHADSRLSPKRTMDSRGTSSRALIKRCLYAKNEAEVPPTRSYKPGARTADAWKFVSEAALPLPLTGLDPGVYHVSVRAWTERAGPTPVRMNLELDGEVVRAFDILAWLHKA